VSREEICRALTGITIILAVGTMAAGGYRTFQMICAFLILVAIVAKLVLEAGNGGT
jgi:hypothetical protein